MRSGGDPHRPLTDCSRIHLHLQTIADSGMCLHVPLIGCSRIHRHLYEQTGEKGKTQSGYLKSLIFRPGILLGTGRQLSDGWGILTMDFSIAPREFRKGISFLLHSSPHRQVKGCTVKSLSLLLLVGSVGLLHQIYLDVAYRYN